jgi:hypothetical protein
LKACVAVGGGIKESENTFGPALEFFDAVPSGFSEDTAQSWANQMVAAKFAKILDRHPEYNIWDAREHLRQAASFWSSGWTERNGFGRVDVNARVGKLLPAPPLEFTARVARNGRQVLFSWRNFLMSDFAATVIARKDGRILYEGTGTNFTWTVDADGEDTFLFWSKNRAGEKSRMEPFQTRTVNGLSWKGKPSCLVLADPGDRAPAAMDMLNVFQPGATNWVCDVACRPGTQLAQWVGLYTGDSPYAAVLPDFGTMTGYAISNRYRMVLVPASEPDDVDPSRHTALWDNCATAGIQVVMAHSALWPDSWAQARRPLPARLGAGITVAYGKTTNEMTYGPGLEFFDAGPVMANGLGYEYSENAAAAALAVKLAAVLDAHPNYNLWDARQHLRQSASHYAQGWSEQTGYGRPAATPAKLAKLELAPPLEIQAVAAVDGKSVTLSWLNYRQTDFAATVIRSGDGKTIYEGTGTNFVWRGEGDATFKFYTKGKNGEMSREEKYTTVKAETLKH